MGKGKGMGRRVEVRVRVRENLRVRVRVRISAWGKGRKVRVDGVRVINYKGGSRTHMGLTSPMRPLRPMKDN